MYPWLSGIEEDCSGRRITVFAQPEPGRIPWEEMGAQIVIESTGRFTDAEQARTHLPGRVKKVIVSAPLHSTAPASTRD